MSLQELNDALDAVERTYEPLTQERKRRILEALHDELDRQGRPSCDMWWKRLCAWMSLHRRYVTPMPAAACTLAVLAAVYGVVTTETAVPLVRSVSAGPGVDFFAAEGSRVAPASIGDRAKLRVHHGRVFVQYQRDKTRGDLLLETPHALVVVRGTRFYISVHSGETVVGVERGRVEVRPYGDAQKPVVVDGGRQARVRPDKAHRETADRALLRWTRAVLERIPQTRSEAKRPLQLTRASDAPTDGADTLDPATREEPKSEQSSAAAEPAATLATTPQRRHRARRWRDLTPRHRRNKDGGRRNATPDEVHDKPIEPGFSRLLPLAIPQRSTVARIRRTGPSLHPTFGGPPGMAPQSTQQKTKRQQGEPAPAFEAGGEQIEEARRLLRSGQHVQALERLRALLADSSNMQLSPRNRYEALALMATIHRTQRRYREAAAILGQLGREGDRTTARFAQFEQAILLAEHMNAPAQAIAVIEQILQADSDDTIAEDAHYALCSLHLQTSAHENRKQAKRCFDDFVAAFPSSWRIDDARSMAGRLARYGG